MFIVLLFLLSLSLHKSVWAMEQEKDSPQESLTKIVKNMIDFEDLDGTLEKITSSIETPDVGKTVLQCCFKPSAIEQWREIVRFSEKPYKACAVGPVVAWLSKENPKSCFYINRRLNNEIRTIRLAEAIGLIDIAPHASKIALTSKDNVEVWNIKKFKKVFKVNFNSEIITALVFYRYNKMILGTDTGDIYPISCSKKTSNKHYRHFKNPNSNRSAIIALATITGDFIISQDLQGVLTTYTRIRKSKATASVKEIYKPQFSLIILFDSENWIASAEGHIHRYKSINETHYQTSEVPGGSLVGKTRFNAYVEFQANLNSTKYSGFAIRSFEGQLLKQMLVLKGIEPVIQKVDISEINHSNKDLIPGYVIYKEDEDKPWTLLATEIPTIAQLAFRLVLAEAYEQKGSKVLEMLFAHQQFKSFGNYMQKLLLSEYDYKNKF